MNDDRLVVLCSHCAARLELPVDGPANLFECDECGERTTKKLGVALAKNSATDRVATEHSVDRIGTASLPAVGFLGIPKKVAIVCAVAINIVVAIAIGAFWKSNHDTEVRNAAAAAESKAATEKALAETAEKDRVQRENGAERAKRALTVIEVQSSIQTMAKKHIADGLFTGPVLSVTCDPVGGGSTDDLTAKTTVFECFVATTKDEDGTMSGRKYHATVNWDTDKYTYGFGPPK